jgi:hypothetical protein
LPDGLGYVIMDFLGYSNTALSSIAAKEQTN